MWYKVLIQIFKNKEVREKVLFILMIFAIFRVLANIPIPGFHVAKLKEFFEKFRVFGLMNIFTGGTLERFSIVMLGVGPYIIAVVILQLLTMIFPALEKMYKEGGEEGRRKFEQYGRILTVPLAAFQSLGMLTLFSREGIIAGFSPLQFATAVFTITAGTVFLMWLGELMSERGIGEGISLLIFAGIVADFPRNIGVLIAAFSPEKTFSYILFFLAVILIISAVVIVTESKRNIPVSYAKRVRGMKLYGGATTYLPLPLNPAGVMPIIFALSLLTLPSMIANFFTSVPGLGGEIAKAIVRFFENPVSHSFLYFLLVFLFTFFYTVVTFDPKTVSENLQKMGGFIPGIRPGKSTAEYLSFVLNRILVFGAYFLSTLALTPTIVQQITKIEAFSFLVGGTSVLILVSVILETFERIKTELEMREYDTF